MKRFFLVVMVLVGLPILSGCVAAIPLLLVVAPTALGVASTVGIVRTFRDGKMELKPFEKTFLPNAEKIQLSKKVVAVAPGKISVEFAKSLEAEGLSIITPYKFSELASAAPPIEATEKDYSDFTKSAGKKIGADLLFFTNIANENLEGYSLTQMFTGYSTTMNHRLVIRLVSSNGEILWKDEMLYSVTLTAGKSIPEKEINSTLASRVIERMKELSVIKPEQKKEEKLSDPQKALTATQISLTVKPALLTLPAQPILSPKEAQAALAPSPSPPAKPPIAYLVITKTANVRAESNVKSKIITTIEKGEKVEKLDKSGNWSNVKLPSGETGWVFKDLVKEAE